MRVGNGRKENDRTGGLASQAASVESKGQGEMTRGQRGQVEGRRRYRERLGDRQSGKDGEADQGWERGAEP